jgi:hypothetical protein
MNYSIFKFDNLHEIDEFLERQFVKIHKRKNRQWKWTMWNWVINNFPNQKAPSPDGSLVNIEGRDYTNFLQPCSEDRAEGILLFYSMGPELS